MATVRVKKKVQRSKPELVYVDTETTGLSSFLGDMPHAVSAINDEDDPEIRYVEWLVDPFTRTCSPEKDDLDHLREWCEDPSITKVFWNAKFDMEMLENIGVRVVGKIEDGVFAARICNNLEDDFKLKNLAYKYFRYPKDDMIGLKDVVKKLRMRARKLGWKLAEAAEADYWIVKHVDTLMPELSKEERERIKCALGVYCIGDTIRTRLMWKLLSPKVASDNHYAKTYAMEMEVLLGPVWAMEHRGMAISRERTEIELNKSKQRAEENLEALQTMVKFDLDWEDDFNPSSSLQLAKALYSKSGDGGYGLRAEKTTAKGNDSTDWKALRPHFEHPFVRHLMAYRSAVKSMDTFFQKYMDMMRVDPITRYNAETGKIGSASLKMLKNDTCVLHPSLNQCGTVTGRFSCNNPNLQQVANSDTSARGTDPIQARAPFGPRPGYVWYTADFAQQELRVFADVAQVASMLEAIHAGRDLNTENANRAWGGKGNPYALEAAAYSLELGHDRVSKEVIQKVWDEIGWNTDKAKHGPRSTIALQTAEDWLAKFNYDIVAAEKSIGKSGTRGRCKCVTFCKLYGGGPGAVTDLLYCSLSEAKTYWKQYDNAFPEINDYLRSASQTAEDQGFIINRYGRKLRVDPDRSYRAVNYMVQSTCADLMKHGMLKCHNFLQDIGIDGHVLFTIHDELIFEIRVGHNYKWVLRELCSLMSDHEGRLNVPMPVEMKKAVERWDKKVAVSL